MALDRSAPEKEIKAAAPHTAGAAADFVGAVLRRRHAKRLNEADLLEAAEGTLLPDITLQAADCGALLQEKAFVLPPCGACCT